MLFFMLKLRIHCENGKDYEGAAEEGHRGASMWDTFTHRGKLENQQVLLCSATSFSLATVNIVRLASQHFKLASDAYQRGEHLSAKQHSMKGREKMDIAQELNSKAATEIFKFNNRKNHIWRMDLHGLHASEAVQALQDRLHKIESEGSEHVHTKPVRHLLVITGVGKHSQGKPVLPTTVKSFLDKYRYHFEEARPGVLKVWPNVHHL